MHRNCCLGRPACNYTTSASSNKLPISHAPGVVPERPSGGRRCCSRNQHLWLTRVAGGAEQWDDPRVGLDGWGCTWHRPWAWAARWNSGWQCLGCHGRETGGCTAVVGLCEACALRAGSSRAQRGCAPAVCLAGAQAPLSFNRLACCQLGGGAFAMALSTMTTRCCTPPPHPPYASPAAWCPSPTTSCPPSCWRAWSTGTSRWAPQRVYARVVGGHGGVHTGGRGPWRCAYGWWWGRGPRGAAAEGGHMCVVGVTIERQSS